MTTADLSSENGSSYDSEDDSLSGEDESLDSSGVDDEEERSNDKSAVYDIANEDTRKLRTWRVIIIVVLILSFVGTITAVISLLRHEANQDEEFVVCRV
jgi:hypothetical protein